MSGQSKPMSGPMRVVLWFVVLNAYAGAAVLIVFPRDTQSKFFWDIAPPINARMFGVLYLAAGSAVLHAVLGRWWEPARYLTAMVPVFTGMMLLTTLLHLDKFDRGFELYYWLAVYVVAPLAGIIFYVQHERKGANWRVVEPIAPVTRTVAVVVGALAALFVLVGYVAPDLIIDTWAWKTSPLMLRVFLSWFGAFAVSCLWFGVEKDWGRVRPVPTLLVGAAALMLAVLLVHRDELESTGWLMATGLIALGLLGLFMHRGQSGLATRRRSPSAA